MNRSVTIACTVFQTGLMFLLMNISLAEPGGVPGSLMLAKDGKTEYRVVIPKGFHPEVKAAADELVLFLEQITGAGFTIVGDDITQTKKEILLGTNVRLKQLGLKLDLKQLGPEGYVIRTVGDRLVIAGGPDRGTINGVYVFLTDYLGCRWFAPDCSVIPKKASLAIPAIDLQKTPPFEIRSVWSSALTRDRDWFVRNHLNHYTVVVQTPDRPDGTRRVNYSDFRSDPRLANAYAFTGYHWHSLGHNSDLLDPEKYFDQHPEYFSLVGGKRMRTRQHPCLTHSEVIKIVTENVKKKLRNDPRARMVDVSLGDYRKLCECSTCSAAYKKYGHSGVYVRFVNAVAAEIEKEYPRVILTTLCGYPPVEGPPLGGVALRHNLLVRSGNTTYCRYHDYEACTENVYRGRLQTLKNWIPIAPGRVMALLYQYGSGPLLPRASQYRLLRRTGVKGVYVFSEDGQTRNYYWDQTPNLRGYLHARLAWDPDFDVEKGIREFCRAYYGAAAPELISYVREINDENSYAGKATPWKELQKRPGFHSGGGFLDPIKPQKLREFDRLFDEAEKKVRDNDRKALRHVMTGRLPLQYCILMMMPKQDPIFQKAARNFLPMAERLGVKKVRNLKAESGPKMQDLTVFCRAMLAD